jgi:hypothetical protein
MKIQGFISKDSLYMAVAQSNHLHCQYGWNRPSSTKMEGMVAIHGSMFQPGQLE